VAFNNRARVFLENGRLRLTLLRGGGHIAAVTLKSNGVEPLWDPPWETIEPSAFDPGKHPQFGTGPEGRLLAGIAGHNLCFDCFGPPSQAEAAAGLTVHGEAGVVDWEVAANPGELRASAEVPLAGMRIERRLRLRPASNVVTITETAENLTAVDRPVGWTQHVTLGPPFLAHGKTIFHAPASSSKVLEDEFAPGHDRFRRGAEFDWPMAPLVHSGGTADLRETVDTPISGAYTAHLMKRGIQHAYFTAYNPSLKTVFGYVWKREDFPWLGIWEENHSRQQPPWNGKTFTRGMEFGVSPFPESRRAMVERDSLFGEPGFRWIPARSRIRVEYCLFIAEAAAPLEAVEWVAGRLRGQDFDLPI
jgi:hypothetical protein